MNEIWKSIVGFEGSYAISSLGQVKSLARIRKGPWGQERAVPGRILKQHVPYNTKHLAVGLSLRGVTAVKRIDRLVLESFVGPCPSGMEARHLNDISTENRRENLEWATPKENGDPRGKTFSRLTIVRPSRAPIAVAPDLNVAVIAGMFVRFAAITCETMLQGLAGASDKRNLANQ
jgi:hypothetical protein